MSSPKALQSGMNNMINKNPELSLVMPCYNEQSSLRHTVSGIVQAFKDEGIDLQLVLVDNGSTDKTEDVIDELLMEKFPVTKVKIEVNQGYGYGILRGFENCKGIIVGFLHADGQISPEDVIAIYRQVLDKKNEVLAKPRRVIRQDGLNRRIVSLCYNGIMKLIFGRLDRGDINASPKVFSRKNLEVMQLSSTDWFLDPEIMIKANYLGLEIVEKDIYGLPRHGGKSNVKLATIIEFIKNIIRYRLGGPLKDWQNDVKDLKYNTRIESRQE